MSRSSRVSAQETSAITAGALVELELQHAHDLILQTAHPVRLAEIGQVSCSGFARQLLSKVPAAAYTSIIGI